MILKISHTNSVGNWIVRKVDLVLRSLFSSFVHLAPLIIPSLSFYSSQRQPHIFVNGHAEPFVSFLQIEDPKDVHCSSLSLFLTRTNLILIRLMMIVCCVSCVWILFAWILLRLVLLPVCSFGSYVGLEKVWSVCVHWSWTHISRFIFLFFDFLCDSVEY